MGQAGDTIIEVMISVAVVAAVLGVSYATANRSLRSGQQAQERGEALKLVESNLERLKYISTKDFAATTIFSQPVNSAFCIANMNSTSAMLSTISGYNPVLNSDNFAGYVSGTTNCRFDSTGNTGGRYNLAIVYTGAGANDTFIVSARWDSLSGTREEVKIPYRIHP
jgi:type II secretory pathway pseudopilin PulG